MDAIFAPWRIEWVKREQLTEKEQNDCVFCRLPSKADARETRVVAKNDAAYVLLNNAPYNPGHVMVIPLAHVGSYPALSSDVLLRMSQLLQRTMRAMDMRIDPDGYNTGMNLGKGAGGSIDDHLHIHVVPRWQEDTNFMPVINDTKVIVQALDETWSELREGFLDQAGAIVDSETAPVVFDQPPEGNA